MQRFGWCCTFVALCLLWLILPLSAQVRPLVAEHYAFNFLRADGHTPLFTSDLFNGGELDTARCRELGINLVFQIRPGANAPDSFRHRTFTVDLADHVRGRGLAPLMEFYQVDTLTRIVLFNVGAIHKDDTHHGITNHSGDSLAMGYFRVYPGDTLFFDAFYRPLPARADSFCGCGQDSLSRNYGRLTRWEIVNPVTASRNWRRATAVGPGSSLGAVLSTCGRLLPLEADLGLGRAGTTFLDEPVPNPFSTSAEVRWGLAEAGPVTLTLRDMTGNPVRAIAQGTRAAGTYSFSLKSETEAGFPLPNGVYFLRLEAGSTILEHKVILLR